MSEQRRLSRLSDGGIEVVNFVLKNNAEGTLAHTIAKGVLNQRKAFLDADLRSAVAEVMFSEGETNQELTEKLTDICADLAEHYDLNPDQLNEILDEIYEEVQTYIYG